MSSYALRRVASTLPVLLGASLVILLLIHLVPGDPAIALAGPDARPEELDAIRRRIALDQPLHVQYLNYLARVVQGDLGRSYYYKDDIGGLLADSFLTETVFAWPASADSASTRCSVETIRWSRVPC